MRASVCILAVALAGLASLAAEPVTDPDAERLMVEYRNATADTITEVMHALAALGERAIPSLEKCSDEKTLLRKGCVEILSFMSAEIATPVLIDLIDGIGVGARSSDRSVKTFAIGAVGRLKSPSAVPYLEAAYETEPDKRSIVGISLAWALHAITGRDYGSATDSWSFCR